MLDDIYLITDLAMATYASNHNGRAGISKADVLEAVMEYGGDMDDVRAVMVECLQRFAPDIKTQSTFPETLMKKK